MEEDVVFLINKKIKSLIGTYLKNYGDKSDILNEVISYSLFSGGKHLRGMITVEMSKLFGVGNDDAILLAAIIEMIHCYSLIHDDLPAVDNADYRRGLLSAHKKFGEANALLAGSLLLVFATEIANKYFSANLVSKINEKVMLMIRGQVIDLSFKNCDLNYDEVINMYKLKTGAMFVLASSMGFVVQNVNFDNDSVVRYFMLEEFGYDFGVLFQINDDLQDSYSCEKNMLNILSREKLAVLTATLKNKCTDSLIKLGCEPKSKLFEIVNVM